ncbi:MAG TPA: hypothetical protein PKD45_15405, partial [Flavobacteriales bacterium]|nr:hypothetical protein [Flavobacteriales bacterium]
MKNRRLLYPTTPRSPWWRHGMAALAMCGLVATAGAQSIDTYSFSASTGVSLDPMTGATTLIGTGQDYATSDGNNIGFTFSFEDIAYSQFSVNENGNLLLGSGSIGGGQVYNALNPPAPKLLPFSVDAGTATGGVSTTLTGSAPNRVRVIQWFIGVPWNAATANTTFQVLLYEGSNNIEFRYGTGSADGNDNLVTVIGAGYTYLNVRPGSVASSTILTPLNQWPGSGTSYLFAPPVGCNFTPAPGNTISSAASVCSGGGVSLSLQNDESGPGVSFQWQSSPDGSTWSNIGGATSSTHNSSPIASATWFRCAVTCAGSAATTNSNPVQVTVSSPAATYAVFAGAQITENFSSWGNRCSTADVPSVAGNNWINTPAFGAGTWRQDNTTTAASGWNNVSGYSYGNGNGAVAPAARFHSRQGGSVTGTLDYHIDMSAGTGGEMLRFEYVNSAGSGTLQVLVSQDGGSTFSSLGTLGASTSPPMNAPFNTWVTREFVIGSTSATTVIRLKGTAAPSASGNDIGVDNFRIIPEPTCKKVTGVSASATGAGEATFSWTCVTCSGNYIIEYGPTGFTPGTAGTAGTNGTVVNSTGSPQLVSGIPAGNYDVYVRENCGGGDFSENSAKGTFGIVGGDFCENAINMSTLPLTDWSSIATTVGASKQYSTSCGTYSGGDVVLYYDVEVGATISFVLNAMSNSVLSVAYGGTCPGTNVLACGTGSYLNVGPYVEVVDWYETFTWTNNGCATERLYILDGAVSTGGMLYIANFSYTPAAGPVCAAVTGIAVSTVNTGSGANVSWNATCSGNVLVEYGLSGFNPGTGTSMPVSGNSTTIPGLTFDVAYDLYVRQDCGDGLYSAYGTATTFTVHNGDDCSRSINLAGQTGFLTVNTTGANNDAAFCSPGDTGGDLMFYTAIANGDAIYIATAPTAPYVGRVVFGAGTSCPGQVLLDCQSGPADFYWQNTTGSTVNFYMIQDGADEGETTISWEKYSFQKVVVSITTDASPEQISWEISDDSQTVVASGTPATANSVVNTTVSLSGVVGFDACYTFRLMDSFGDGITNGGWALYTTGGKLILRDDFASGSESPAATPASPAYGSGHSFCLPLGPADIAANECNIFDNLLGNKVYCNKVTGAANYQFEFSNPDAGFIRRIARPYNYVAFGDMVTNPLTPGVKYFARVRT